MSVLEEFALICASIADMDFNETPVSRLQDELIHAVTMRVPRPDMWTKVVYRMDISVTSFDINDPLWKNIIDSYAEILVKVWRRVPDEDTLLAIAPKISIKYEE